MSAISIYAWTCDIWNWMKIWKSWKGHVDENDVVCGDVMEGIQFVKQSISHAQQDNCGNLEGITIW